MAHYIFNHLGDASLATSLLQARRWGVDAEEPHRDALSPGDLALVYLAAPERKFIACAELASAVHEWRVSEEQAYPGNAPGGVSLARVEEWDPPVAMSTVLARIDRSAGARADFAEGVVRITADEYETALAVAAECATSSRKSDRSGAVTSLDVRTLLASVEAAPPIDAAEVVAASLTEALGARDVSFLIADYSGQALVRLSHVHRSSATDEDVNRERGQSIPVAGTPHGRALTQQEIQIVSEAGAHRVFAPVTSRGEAVGVLALGFEDEPDRQTLATVSAGAHALAYIIIANRRFTDLFDWGQRSVPLSLEAELQHRLLPASYTCEGGQFTLAGWLEPAGDVGGDTFDFSVERDTLHLSMTDAMGHTLNAAVLATVLVGALRNGRRRAVDLAEQTRLANDALCEFAVDGDFVTGQVVRIDHASGVARIVNAGHPLPILMRDGRAEDVGLAPGLPFGIEADADYQVQELALQAGDRLVFLTDGILERNATDVDAAKIVRETRHLHPREAVQALIQEVVKACGGELRDDATVLCLDWHGGRTGERDTSSGADR